MTIAMLIAAGSSGDQQISSSATPGSSPPRSKQFVEVTGEGPLGQTMACLEMLARHHKVPFRRRNRACSER